jgi:hypothetical protein
MDDYGSIKATPQSPLLGLFANGLTGLDGLLSENIHPSVADGLGVRSLASVMQDMSYGVAPVKGSGMATRLSPDLMSTAGAALNYAPFMASTVPAKVGLGVGGFSLQGHGSLDSVIEELLQSIKAGK